MGAKLSGSGGAQEEMNSTINVTPFVDVMLVLLIIFMVAAPLAAVTVKVALPPAVAKPGTNPPKPVYISIQPNGRIFIQDFPTDLASLGDDLRKQVGAKRDPAQDSGCVRGRVESRSTRNADCIRPEFLGWAGCGRLLHRSLPQAKC